MGKKDKKKNYHLVKELISEITLIGVVLYLFVMFFFFPIYVRDHYWDMALNKWNIYWKSTLGLVLGVLVLFIIECLYFKIYRNSKKGEMIKREKNCTDILVAVYGGLVVISFFFAPDKRAALLGLDGWYMGVVTQMLLVATYFIFSNIEIPIGILGVFHGGASSFCFFYAICQRLGYDWLHLYWDMPAEVVRDYLSTLGNRTWFSAYVCTAFPIGVYLFWSAKKTWVTYLTGGYVFLAFQCLLVTGSDSAYMALVAVMYILGLLSVGNGEKLKRLLGLMMIWFSGCGTFLVLREFIAEYPKDIRGISRIFLNEKVVILALLGLMIIFVGISWIEKNKKINKKNVCGEKMSILLGDWSVKRIRQCQFKILLVTGIFAVLFLGFIYLNSSGLLQKLLRVTVKNKYLLFDDNWGDYRGYTWKITMNMFAELPIVQKLFGVGADCYALHVYSNEEYAALFRNLWGETIMPNAHNEWLNSLFCFGIIGGVMYIAFFSCIAWRCLVKVDFDKVHPMVPGIGLCIVAYMAHNFFCYQQVCATSLIFVLMGVAMKLKKEEEKGLR